jgi:hypothetical protein
LRPNPAALAQQLYLVSLALEQAIAAENWIEADALFQSRAELIEKVSHVTLAGQAREIMELVLEHEERLIQAVRDSRRVVGGEAAAFTLAQRAVQTYLAA